MSWALGGDDVWMSRLDAAITIINSVSYLVEKESHYDCMFASIHPLV